MTLTNQKIIDILKGFAYAEEGCSQTATKEECNSCAGCVWGPWLEAQI